MTRPGRTYAWLLAMVLAGLWLLLAPPTPDLAAQVYRSDLFSRIGFSVWDLSWYGGHHMPGYSLLFPPLGALLGPRLVGAIAAVVSVILFERILAAVPFSQRATRVAALWFAVAVTCDLLIGRLTFSLGVTVGLGAVLALQRGHPWVAAALGIACAGASPVTGVFVALVGAAVFLDSRDVRALALCGGSLGLVIVLALLFPEGGEQPFTLYQIVIPLVASIAVLITTPDRYRVLRIGTALYMFSCVVTLAIPSPLGNNILRLGALVAGPLLAALWLDQDRRPSIRRTQVLAAIGVAFLAWQLTGPVREVVKAVGDPSTKPEYFAPVLGFLKTHADASTRIEVPFTRGHWEAAYLAPHIPLARGWETQLDEKYGALFYQHRDETFTANAYHAWLKANAVQYVAVSDAPADPTSVREVAVIDTKPAWLTPVWTSEHWRVFAVKDSEPMVSGRGATLTSLTADGFTLRASRPTSVVVRVRSTPYYTVTTGSGCVSADPDGWTRVRALKAGSVHVDAKFAIDDVLGDGPRCSTPATRR